MSQGETMRLPWIFKERDKGTFGKEWTKDPLYTLDELMNYYLSMEDLTEYLFALKYIPGGYEEWLKIANSSLFSSILSKWRSHLEIKLKAEAIARIIEEARIGGKNSHQCRLFLVHKGWISKDVEPSRRGRPSKEEINRIAHEEAMSNHIVDEDLKRLRELDS